MKVVKPQRLGLLTRVLEHERKHSLVVSLIAYVPFDRPGGLLTEAALWKETADHIPGGVVDEGTPKARGEVLVSGCAHAPPGGPAKAVMLRLAVERGERRLVDKKLAVIGDRHWLGNDPSEPATFTSIVVDMAHAFGGEGYADNPWGKGFAPIATEHGPVLPLPNVEDPKHLVANKSDRRPPAGFGPLDITLPQRMRRMGKRYDEEWLKKRFPGPAEDFDVHFYNVARDDQWLDGFFDQSERFVVEGMHPKEPRISLTLEPLVMRVFLTQRDGEGERFFSTQTRLDTVHLLPELGRAVLVHRAVVKVAEDDADDVIHLMVAAESPDHPKPIEHYQRVLARRLDKDEGALASLQDGDLLPPPVEGWSPRLDTGDVAEMTKLEMRQLENMDRGRSAELAAARIELAAAGFDVEDDEPVVPKLEDPEDIEALASYVAELRELDERLQREHQERRAELEAEARAAYAEAGLDYDAEAARAEAEAGGPPTFSAEEHLVMLHDMARISHEGGSPMDDLERDLLDPRFEESLVELERRVREGYVAFAHVSPAARAIAPSEAQMLRVRIIAAKDAGESMARQNLTRADLHGLDLRGLDLDGAFLEGADLRDANLEGASLRGAVLARADLTRTRLVEADLTGANLGGTRLEATDLSGAKLNDAVFMRSELVDVGLVGARFGNTNFFETVFAGADFSHAILEAPLFMLSDLRSVAFTGAQASTARFLDVDLRGVDFTGARLDQAQFLKCRGDGANFAGASLAGAVFVYETSFVDACFARADLTGANFRKTPLTRGDFRGASLHKADLSGCDLTGANLHRIGAREALMIRTLFAEADLRGADLLGAIMQKARLFGADLRGTNLSRADVSLVQVDGRTRLDDALMINTRVDPQYEEPR